MKKIKVFTLLVLLLTNLSALSLRDSVQQTMTTNPTIMAEHKNQDAFKKYVDEEKGDYLPTVDLESYYETSHTYNNPNKTEENDAHKNGWNTQLKIEQMLYDGGLTSSEISEYIYRRDGNNFRSSLTIENVVLNTTNSYLDMVQYKEQLKLSSKMMSVQEKNLVKAKEQEEISGEKLEIYEVSSKLHFTTEIYLEQEDLEFQAKYNFKRFTGIKPEDKICRPVINENIIPMSLEKTIKLAVQRNYSVLEQIENIKVQREKITQSDSNFLPSLSFQLQGQWDDDLELEENGRQDIYRARFYMKWNLYKGGKNSHASQREILFLKEAKKTLDAITNEIVNTVTKDYNSFYKTKQRIGMLKLYIGDNKNILDLYREEFNAGTRTFIDILNAESEVYTSNTSLIEREFELYKNYYNLLLNLSLLSNSILAEQNLQCQNMPDIKIFDSKIDKESVDLDNELEELMKEEKSQKSIEEFMNSSGKYYTLNITTESGIEEANYVLNKYNIVDAGYIFRFGENLSKAKVLYGIYPTYEEAKKALEELSSVLINKHSPYIDSVNKHQKLYNRYN